MKIIRYGSSNDVDVEFLDGTHYVREHNTYRNFVTGNIKSPYDKTLFGAGYLGEGKWRVKDENDNFSRVYLCWMHMIERCYYEKNKDLHQAYFGRTTVCDEWLCYQTFADWYSEREYEVGERLHLDKDIKVPGNMIYAPDKCLLVPQRLNMMFMNKSNKRGLPNGIIKQSNGYLAQYHHMVLGVFPTVEMAYEIQTIEKKKDIIRVANEYKDIIPKEVYDSILAYEFDIKNDKNYAA